MDEVRSHCHGQPALPGRLLGWQRDVLADHALCEELLGEHGSPVNLICPEPLPGHAAELVEAGSSRSVDLRVFFARKANKALALVDAALAAGHGVDVASERELTQVLGRGAAPDRVILTAAVKPRPLLRLAAVAGVAISLDNADEVEALADEAAALGVRPRVGLRLASRLTAPSRFGLPAAAWNEMLRAGALDSFDLQGVHFHLHGYAAADRSAALDEALHLVDVLGDAGHSPAWIDLGGGIPMRYLDDPAPWAAFWDAHRRALAEGRPLTWEGRGLGLSVVDGQVHGSPAVYPMWQDLVRGEWLGSVLDAPVVNSVRGDSTLAEEVRRRGLRLHVEPGRSLLDGCGLTLARVEARKECADGSWLVALAMNRTQCRSAADDFLLDPVLVPKPRERAATPAAEGFLVGAYCIEAELLTWRRLTFPSGVAVGDVVAFVNTGGYQMHILESASHQIPLARNLVLGEGRWGSTTLTAADPRELRSESVSDRHRTGGRP